MYMYSTHPPSPTGFTTGDASLFFTSSTVLALLASLDSKSTVFVTLKKEKQMLNVVLSVTTEITYPNLSLTRN